MVKVLFKSKQDLNSFKSQFVKSQLVIFQSGRLYATKLLRVSLRAGVSGFSSWGIQFLVNQLYDQSRNVAMTALSVLEEACEVKVGYSTFYQYKLRSISILCINLCLFSMTRQHCVSLHVKLIVLTEKCYPFKSLFLI